MDEPHIKCNGIPTASHNNKQFSLCLSCFEWLFRQQQPANVQCLVRPLGVDMVVYVHCFNLTYFVFPFCKLELLGWVEFSLQTISHIPACPRTAPTSCPNDELLMALQTFIMTSYCIISVKFAEPLILHRDDSRLFLHSGLTPLHLIHINTIDLILINFISQIGAAERGSDWCDLWPLHF